MTRLELRLLGTLHVTRRDGAAAHFQSDKVRALLAYLATEADRPHARASLAALLWPDQRDQAALRNLSQTLVRLRDALGHTDEQPAPLRVTAQSIQWLPDTTEVDAATFSRLARSSDPRDLARAAALYQGEFLAGFSLPGCEAFEEWLLVAREQFHQQALAALHTLAEQHLAAQRWADADAAARRQIELDRWREDAHRQLMRALAGLGDRAAALAAYQRCEQILRDDLNIAPDAATTALAAMIRAGAIGGANAPATAPATAESPEPRPALPAPLSALIGREHELERITALLHDDRTRLLTIVGVGGAGKTRLALAAAWSLRDAFAGGAGWVPLAGIAPNPDPALLADALATAVGAALGLPFDGRRAPLDELRRSLAERALLLVLDNCEHLPVAGFARTLLADAPRLRVLATSRVPLNLAGEALLRLEGLPVPERGAEEPALYAGVQLFLERARRHVHEIGQTSAGLAAVARLCRLLDGLPLGIELAARWVGHYTCEEIAAEIESDLDFLAAYGGDAPERHHSLRAVFDYSWAMLREPQRLALARLSVFRGSFDRAAAQAIALTPVTILAALIDASLLRHPGVGRYGFHDLVRQFAAARLADRGEAEALAERHATYYLDLLAQQEPLLYGGAQQAAAAVIRDAADNLRQAWGWAVAHRAWEGIARSLPALRQYTWIDGLFYENAARVAEAAEQIEAQLAQGAAAPEQIALLGRLRATEAAFLERQEARAAAAAAARAGIANAAAAGDAIGEAYAYLQLSNAAVPYIASLAPREADQAIGWLQRAIELCRATPARESHERRLATEIESSCLLKLSTIRIDLREYAEACTLAEQALALTRINGDRLQEARALSFSAMALENAGRYQAAYERRMAMLELARANGSRPQEHVALNNLSCTLIYMGDYPAALKHAQSALGISGEWMQNPYQHADSYHTLSWAACRAGETELALTTARQALALAQSTGMPQNQTLPLLALGDALHDLHRYDEAHAAYTTALELGRDKQTPQPAAVALAGIARCRMAQAALADAQAAAEEILRGPDVLTLGSLWEPLRIAETCYQVLRTAGDARADELLRAAAALLDQQAEQIADQRRRHIFREQVAAHRAILAALAGSLSDKETSRQADKQNKATGSLSPNPPVSLSPHWGDAPPIVALYGRQAELAQIERRIVHDRCRLVAVLGIGGVGKTTLAAAAANAVAAQFEIVIWRSLLNAPPLEDVLRDILQRLAQGHAIDLPASLDAQLNRLADDLRRQRCLLVLDNLESILDADRPGQMRPGYEGYARLLQSLAEREHTSCLLLTSREQPHGWSRWEHNTPLVSSLSLGGLDAAAGQALLAARGLPGASAEATALIERYSGNPLALRLVAQTVQDLFGSDIAGFLAAAAPIFDDIRTVLDQQFARLSALEQEILIWLAIEREPIAIAALRDNLIDAGSPRVLLEALRGLQRRSLIEQHAHGCALQNVVIEYLTDLLVEQVAREITGELENQESRTKNRRTKELENQRTGDGGNEADRFFLPPDPLTLSWLNRFALLKATAKEYVRDSQKRLIVEPLAQRLLARLGRARVVEQLKHILAELHAQPDITPGYAAGNLLNLLLHLQVDLRGYDLSGLHIRQAYLQGAHLPDVSLRAAGLAQSVFTHIFGEILALHFDAEQQLLVAGVSGGRLRLWRAADGRLEESQALDADATIATFSADGRTIATGDTDHQVRLWDVSRGRLLHSLAGHAETPWGLMFSPDGTLLASSGADGVVYVWDVPTGRLRQSLRGHASAVPALAFSGDGLTLASGDVGGMICIWRMGTPEPLDILRGHTEEVHALVFDAAGAILASGSHDRTIGLWDTSALPSAGSTRLLHNLNAHTEVIRTLAISPDGRTLASGGGDTFVCLWDVRSGQALHTLLDQAHRTNFLSFSANGRTLASAGGDQTICLWDVATGRRLDRLQAYSNALYALDWSPDGQQLASGGTDSIARLWDVSGLRSPDDRQPAARALQGHTSWVFSVAYSPDGATLASAGCDHTIRLWDVRGGRTIRSLRGHTDDVEAIQFSPNGRWLVSGSRDTTLRVWDVRSGQAICILQGHAERIHTCAFSPDGVTVASGSIDRTVRLWDVSGPLGGDGRDHAGARTLHTLAGHTNALRCVAFSADGRILASSAFDQAAHLWDVQRGQMLYTLPAHDTITTSIAFGPGGSLLATGGKDHAVRIWEIAPHSASGESAPHPWPQGAVRLRRILRGHTNSVEAVRFSPDGRWAASASTDTTVRVWDVASGACIATLRAEGPYAGMNIAGATGISAAQRAALIALGAVEND